MDRKIFGALLAYTALLLYLAGVISILLPYLHPLLWAAILAILTFPIYDKLYVAVKERKTLAAGLMTSLVILILVIPVVLLIFFLANQGEDFYTPIENAFPGSPSGVWNRVKTFPLFSFFQDILDPFLDLLGVDLQETIKLSAQKGFDYLVGFSTTIVKKSLSFTLKLLIMALSLFFLYRDGKNFLDHLLALVPLEVRTKNELVSTVKDVLSKLLYGLFLASLVQGMLASVGYWLVGLPVPLLFGAATALVGLIPIVGTALIWAPLTFYLLLSGKIFQGLILLAWGGGLIAPSDNLIRAVFMSGRAGTTYIPPLVVILGILGGLSVFGVTGIILGPIMLALLFSVLELFIRKPSALEAQSESHPPA
jgi:predicted PurR-regulated permease PerM